MNNFWTTLKESVNRATERGSVERPVNVVVALPFARWAAAQSDGAVYLDSCREFDRIVVRTRYSVYELIVLSGTDGDVLIRGGRTFPDFRRARFEGSTAGGSALSLRSVDVGRRMELQVGRKRFTTSTIQTVSRIDAPCDSIGRDAAVIGNY
jgi:hypothetical protein